jgi:hypothetical protein
VIIVVEILPILIPSLAGAATASVGILTYWQGQNLKRKEILFPLIEELTNSKSLFLAKAVLDDFTCNIPEFTESDSEMIRSTLVQDLKSGTTADTWKRRYGTDNLGNILRYHEEEGQKDVTDYREIIVRASFDALIKFYARLEYLKDIGIFKEKELSYFRYYYDKLLAKRAVCDYIVKYELALKGSLFEHEGIKKCRDRECSKCKNLQTLSKKI